ncbi:hypothetical protein AFE02nite_12370 [Actinotalea fermentans]|uniref:Uncharacterized protein n=1 Tax=Actinotalea fermentans TaxID=43671 RepID=A0A511YWB6_9CELL|nr:hypothetical protein AFE02nite_12370 [Actinotalea fermentans]
MKSVSNASAANPAVRNRTEAHAAVIAHSGTIHTQHSRRADRATPTARRSCAEAAEDGAFGDALAVTARV